MCVASIDYVIDLFHDVSGYLISPFFVFQVSSRDEAEWMMGVGGVGEFIASVLTEVRNVARRKGLRKFRFSVLVFQNGKYLPLSKDGLLKLAGIMERLHQNGLKHYLERTPNAVGFFKKYYIEDSSTKPLVERKVRMDWGVGGGVDTIIRIYDYSAPELKSSSVVEVISKRPKQVTKGGELTREEVEKLLRNYSPSQAKLVEERGCVRIKEYGGHLFAEVEYRWVKTARGYEMNLGSTTLIEPPHQTLDEVIRYRANDALFNMRLSCDIYEPIRIIKQEKDSEVKVIYVALVRNKQQ